MPPMLHSLFFYMIRQPPTPTLFPYTTLFRSHGRRSARPRSRAPRRRAAAESPRAARRVAPARRDRSEEHTSELQSRFDLVCRLLLEKKKKHTVIVFARSPDLQPLRHPALSER